MGLSKQKEATVLPLISVIVPTYNTFEYIDDCINSLKNQTYSKLEIIIVDDCSTDGTLERLDFWAKQDFRIKVVKKTSNNGVSDSRNIGLNMVSGDYITFVDSDDYVSPSMYEKMLHILQASNADIAVCGRAEIEGQHITECVPEYKTGTVLDADEMYSYILPKITFPGRNRQHDVYIWDKLYKRSAIQMVNGDFILFDTGLTYCEDVVWLTRILLNQPRTVIYNEALYCYRKSRSGNTLSTMQSGITTRYTVSAINAYTESYHMMRAHNKKLAMRALQRILYHKWFGMHTSLSARDQETYRFCSKNYISELLYYIPEIKNYRDFLWLGMTGYLYMKQRLLRLRDDIKKN